MDPNGCTFLKADFCKFSPEREALAHPDCFGVAQIQALLDNLREPVRTMVLVDVSTGLRIGELLALQWRDIDFENLEISVTRSISVQHIGDCKTEPSTSASCDGIVAMPLPSNGVIKDGMHHVANPGPASVGWRKRLEPLLHGDSFHVASLQGEIDSLSRQAFWSNGAMDAMFISRRTSNLPSSAT